MIATGADALLAASNQMQIIGDEKTALQVQIYLLQQIAGNGMTPQQLLAAANQYQLISDSNTARQVIVYLLGQIVNIV